MLDENNTPFQYCLVGNIIGLHYHGNTKVIKSGTKHFIAGTKVYCALIYSGQGNEQIMVFGKKRKSFRMIDVVIGSHYIKNLRVQKVYSPTVIAFIKRHRVGYDDDVSAYADYLINRINNNHIELKEAEKRH